MKNLQIRRRAKSLLLSLLILKLPLLIFSCRSDTNGIGVWDNLIFNADSLAAQHQFNGVILISSDSGEIYKKAFGFSDLDRKTQLKSSDQFVIGSISKQFTAVLVLREVESGRIDRFDSLGRYLPEIEREDVKSVTIHELLTHTHGIEAIDKPLIFKPGTQFQYSQLGYGLLSQILEVVTGESFESLSTELFEDFGLRNTYHPADKRLNDLVKGYEENQNGVLEFATNSLDNYVAAGAFISNVDDLRLWNELLYSGKLVSPEVLNLMKTRYATRIHPIFEEIEYGYGLLFKEGEENAQIGAFGYAPGFASSNYFYPQSGINLIVLENTARNLDDFKQTFIVHTELMKLVKQY